MLEHGAAIQDDRYLGDGDALFSFNSNGLQSLSRKLGVGFDLLARLETPSLASQVMNDLLSQREIRTRLRNDDFVVHEPSGTIIGLVSSTYVTYSNHEFVTDVMGLLGQLPNGAELQFKEAYGINTEFVLRMTLKQSHGAISGSGGHGEDRSELGLDLRNTMVGNSSIRINHFLYRLICANGLMVPAAKSINRLFHSGRREKFNERLRRSLGEVIRNIDSLQGLLTTIGAMPFEPAALAMAPSLTDAIFDVIPGSKQLIGERENLLLRYPQDLSGPDREQMRRKHDTRMIKLIPKHSGGELSGRIFHSDFRDTPTMFDFINVFTEHAKSERPALKLEIEEKTGALAAYIAANARKL